MGLDLTGLGSVADLAKTVVDKIFPPSLDPKGKAEAQIRLQEVLQQRETSLLETQKAIIVSEMSQGDNFTKRARPSIVYCGLFFIFLVHVFLPSVAFFTDKSIPTLSLPPEFWWAWGGVCSIWVIGRSAEKSGASGSMVNMITGSKF